jgi:hypothetical protein
VDGSSIQEWTTDEPLCDFHKPWACRRLQIFVHTGGVRKGNQVSGRPHNSMQSGTKRKSRVVRLVRKRRSSKYDRWKDRLIRRPNRWMNRREGGEMED